MKKWLIIIIACFVLAVVMVYTLIPKNNLVSGISTITATIEGLHRNLANEATWVKWWPGNYIQQYDNALHKKFIYNGYTYSIDEIQISSFVIAITKNNFTVRTFLQIFPDENNTLKLLWEGNIHSPVNPVNRLQMYRVVKKVNKDIQEILAAMQLYFSKDENIYGIHILKEHIVDSILIFKNAISRVYPTKEFVYSLVNNLKKFIKANSGHETGFPMLNINTDDNINYQVKVAIPVNRKLPHSDSISLKLMPGGGNILVTEVKGDQNLINDAFNHLQEYVNDHHYVVPAIPFESLITDRSKEPDPRKWVTRIYYPVANF